MNIDEMIAKALEEEFEEHVEQYTADMKKHRFSLAYKLWEHKTLKELRKGKTDDRWTLKKARYAVTVFAVALVLLVVGGTAYATMTIKGRYRFEDNTDYSKMLIKKHPSDKTTFEEYYGLPEEDGWEPVEYDISFPATLVNYKRDGTNVNFQQTIIFEGNIGNINTEKADVEMLSLYTEDDGFVMEYSDDWTAIYWMFDGYLLQIVGNINKSEAIELVYSTKIIKLPKT